MRPWIAYAPAVALVVVGLFFLLTLPTTEQVPCYCHKVGGKVSCQTCTSKPQLPLLGPVLIGAGGAWALIVLVFRYRGRRAR